MLSDFIFRVTNGIRQETDIAHYDGKQVLRIWYEIC